MTSSTSIRGAAIMLATSAPVTSGVDMAEFREEGRDGRNAGPRMIIIMIYRIYACNSNKRLKFSP
ncbi:MAG: hypothetical protein ACRYHA_25175, partial [Janthinobacterium lividum]